MATIMTRKIEEFKRIIVMDAGVGEHIENTIEDMVRVYNRYTNIPLQQMAVALQGESSLAEKIINSLPVEIQCEFNGINVVVDEHNCSKKVVLAKWDEQVNQRRKAYESSNEYKEQQKQEAEKIERMNKKLDILMGEFRSLDYQDYKSLLQWIGKVQNYTDTIGVNKVGCEICQTLIEHGYKAGENVGENFNEKDRENVARYIIGQTISMLSLPPHAIHHIISIWTENWLKEKEE